MTEMIKRARRLSVSHFALSASFKTGLYIATKKRLMGLFISGRMRPFMSHNIKIGTRVIDKAAAIAMAYVLVKARGAKSL